MSPRQLLDPLFHPITLRCRGTLQERDSMPGEMTVSRERTLLSVGEAHQQVDSMEWEGGIGQNNVPIGHPRIALSRILLKIRDKAIRHEHQAIIEATQNRRKTTTKQAVEVDLGKSRAT